ncbi:MAG: OsmC family protein [Candidatus Nanopelagicaceae bacterium]
MEITNQPNVLSPIPEDFIRRKTLSAYSSATMRTVIDYGEFGYAVTDEPKAHGGESAGPSPLQAVVGALCGCEAVTFRRTASEMNFEYSDIAFDAGFTIDIRGRMGDRSVRPHFQSVKVHIRVTTKQSPEELTRVIEETEARCPVMNLLQDAKVKLEVKWQHIPG